MRFINPKTSKPLSMEEEVIIIQKARSGDRRAMDLLITSNYRFVVNVAMQFLNRGIEMEDLVGEGVLGLRRAVNEYSVEKGIRFLSYAVWWIRQAMLDAIIKRGLSVRLPINWYSRQKPKSGRKKAILEAKDETARKRELIWLARTSPSLSAMMDGGWDVIDTSPGPDVEASQVLVKSVLDAFLSSLDPEDKMILRAVYGLDTGEMETLDSVGRRLGVTRERIRQRRNQAIKILKLRFKREAERIL